MNTLTITCCSCSRLLPAEGNFSRNKGKPLGFNSQCRECAKTYNARWRSDNVEYLKTAKAADYQQNRDRYLASTQAYRDANRTKINAWFKQYREANPELMKARKSRYYEANKEAISRRIKDYRKTRPEIARISCHKRKARMRQAPGTCSRKQFLAKIEYHGWRCYLCKTSLSIKELQMDHRVPLARGGSNWPANLAPACKPCNLSKGIKTDKEFLARMP